MLRSIFALLTQGPFSWLFAVPCQVPSASLAQRGCVLNMCCILVKMTRKTLASIPVLELSYLVLRFLHHRNPFMNMGGQAFTVLQSCQGCFLHPAFKIKGNFACNWKVGSYLGGLALWNILERTGGSTDEQIGFQSMPTYTARQGSMWKRWDSPHEASIRSY